MEPAPLLERLIESDLTLLVEAEDDVLCASDRPGLQALRDFALQHTDLLDGSDVALPDVGLAAAYLLLHAKVGRVWAGVISDEAKQLLSEEGIEFEAGKTRRTDSKDPVLAELDALARDAVSQSAFVEDLRRQRT